MKELKLNNVREPEDILNFPVYAVGEVLSLSEGLREIMRTDATHVLAQTGKKANCRGCFFEDTTCTNYLSVRCTAYERQDDTTVIFTPCLKSGELLRKNLLRKTINTSLLPLAKSLP